MRLITKIFVTLILVFSASLVPLNSFSQQFKALLFTKTDGFHHVAVNEGVDAIRELSKKHHFSVDWHEDAGRINDKNLENYDLVIFLLTTGDILNEEQQTALTKFIQSGKGFVGVHSASDTEYEWEWYRKMVGHMFKIHPVIQTATINVVDANFPGMERMPSSFLWTDEWYEFGEAEIDDLNYLMTLDESTYDPNVQWGERVGKGMGDMHPMSWYHEYDGGRAFYTALGHVPDNYKDRLFLEHLYGAIYWAATGNGIKKENSIADSEH